MIDYRFDNEKARRENARLRSLLKPGEKYCPTCGRITARENEICEHCEHTARRYKAILNGIKEAHNA